MAFRAGKPRGWRVERLVARDDHEAATDGPLSPLTLIGGAAGAVALLYAMGYAYVLGHIRPYLPVMPRHLEVSKEECVASGVIVLLLASASAAAVVALIARTPHRAVHLWYRLLKRYGLLEPGPVVGHIGRFRLLLDAWLLLMVPVGGAAAIGTLGGGIPWWLMPLPVVAMGIPALASIGAAWLSTYRLGSVCVRRAYQAAAGLVAAGALLALSYAYGSTAGWTGNAAKVAINVDGGTLQGELVWEQSDVWVLGVRRPGTPGGPGVLVVPKDKVTQVHLSPANP